MQKENRKKLSNELIQHIENNKVLTDKEKKQLANDAYYYFLKKVKEAKNVQNN